MKAEAVALALGMMLTVEQRDAHRSMFERSSAAVSANGRFVAFTTYSQLARADANSSTDIYLLNRVTERVETLESADTAPYTGSSAHPSISGDGRYVVFERGNVVMLRDRREGVTRIIGEGNHPSITENGRQLLFAARRVDGVAGADVNGNRTDIYVTDLQGAKASRVSVGLKGLNASLTASDHPAASSDGRYVAFVTRGQGPGTRAPDPQVFVRDTEPIPPGMSALDGTRRSAATDASSHLSVSKPAAAHFFADLHTGKTRAITKSVRRGLANGASGKPKMSSDGRFVVFRSEASDLVAAEDFNLLWDVFVFDRTTGAMTRVSGDAEGERMESSAGPSIDARGSVVAFSSRHPTDVSDKHNDFDLYVVTIACPNTASMSSPQRHGDAEIISEIPAPQRTMR